ncbi:MAG: hypothetical protein PHU27_08670 [Salinivirgaceae bacterium]|nr:hypothetical protein [Salinivirgaceae bacterium]MDD4746901.1 hypothetical protein [Salinivirgaceae bacterium]
MKNVIKIGLTIITLVALYRIISNGFGGWIPYDIYSWLNAISDIAAISISYLLMQLLISKSFEKHFHWIIVLTFSLLPALLIMILFRVILVFLFI